MFSIEYIINTALVPVASICLAMSLVLFIYQIRELWRALRHRRAMEEAEQASKWDKSQVGYHTSKSLHLRCGTCAAFRGTGACAIVAGGISPDGVCDLWDARGFGRV